MPRRIIDRWPRRACTPSPTSRAAPRRACTWMHRLETTQHYELTDDAGLGTVQCEIVEADTFANG